MKKLLIVTLIIVVAIPTLFFGSAVLAAFYEIATGNIIDIENGKILRSEEEKAEYEKREEQERKEEEEKAKQEAIKKAEEKEKKAKQEAIKEAEEKEKKAAKELEEKRKAEQEAIKKAKEEEEKARKSIRKMGKECAEELIDLEVFEDNLSLELLQENQMIIKEELYIAEFEDCKFPQNNKIENYVTFYRSNFIMGVNERLASKEITSKELVDLSKATEIQYTEAINEFGSLYPPEPEVPQGLSDDQLLMIAKQEVTKQLGAIHVSMFSLQYEIQTNCLYGEVISIETGRKAYKIYVYRDGTHTLTPCDTVDQFTRG